MISIGNLQINKLCLGDVAISKAYLGDVEVYSSKTKYMTITVDDAAGETTISTNVYGTLSPNLQYRVNNGDWSDFICGTTSITAKPGYVVQFKGLNPDGLSSSSNFIIFNFSDSVHLSGNIMSLIDGIGETKIIPNSYCFNRLFISSKVKTVSKDFLPATTLTSSCYYMLFDSCKKLTQAPELPANKLESNCYCSLFNGCTSLLTAPDLPATTLSERCYYQLFDNCTSLEKAPILNSQTLVDSCYGFMFSGCSKLNYVKSLATNITATNALNNWLNNVSSTGTFVKPAGVTYTTGASGIPEGWSVEEI